MKYMGGKTQMLRGHLGHRLLEGAAESGRFVDLFAGSGAVTHFVSQRVERKSVAVDLLEMSTVLAGAINTRSAAFDPTQVLSRWFSRASSLRESWGAIADTAMQLSTASSDESVRDARRFSSAAVISGGFVVNGYGGHYFSPYQAVILDSLRATLPRLTAHRIVALAALIRAASRAAASPGHTAQPFQPTAALLPHIRTAWSVDVLAVIEKEVTALAGAHALCEGAVHQGGATEFLRRHGRPGDFIFCDPPYSQAQYSRFYHVLEGIARGGWGSVAGAGRSPLLSERTRSDFSQRRMAVIAMGDLLTAAAANHSTVLITYPEGERSNSLTVEDIRRLAQGLFDVEESRIASVHSTLGGSNASGREGRRQLYEVLFTLRSRDRLSKLR